MRNAGLLSTCIFCLLAGMFTASPGAVFAGVVTLDAAGKSASSDSEELEPLGVQAKGGHIGVYIQNRSSREQTLVFRVVGLEDGIYDLYLNRTALQPEDEEELLKASGGKGRVITNPGQLIAGRTRADLEQGVQLTIPGDIGQPDLLRCLKAVRPTVDEEYRRLQMFQSGEPRRVWHTMAQASDWVRSALAKDEAYRSVSVIVVPAGEKPARMSWRTRLDKDETVATLRRACELLQMARSRMSHVINDQTLRNSAVRALTPVEFGAVYEAGSGAARILVELVNNCNIPVSGNISVDVPKGWKLENRPPEFRDIRPGGKFTATVELKPAAAKEDPPNSIAVAANVSISQVLDPREYFDSDPGIKPFAAPLGPREYRAELKIRQVLERERTGSN